MATHPNALHVLENSALVSHLIVCIEANDAAISSPFNDSNRSIH